MKKLLPIAIFAILSSCNYAYAQTVAPTPEPQVLVSQSFLNDAAKAFTLIVTLRDELQKEKDLNAAKGVTSAAKDAQIVALNDLIKIFERKDVIYQSLLDLRDQAFAVYEKIIKIQSEMIDRLYKQINKGKSGWDKFVGVVKTVAAILAGAYFGRLH